MGCSCNDPAKKAAREARRKEQALLRQQRRVQTQANAEKKVKANA